MIRLAEQKYCTACGACAFICPQHCISMQEDEHGIIFPVIDSMLCVECGQCQKHCPIMKSIEPYMPQRAYAAWSNDKREKETSASGGVAIEIYKYCLLNGYTAVGASQNEDFSVTHKIARTEEELRPFKNSKYVFSDAYEVLPQIRLLLKEGEKVVFIGLPCQVAALRKIFNDHENLLLIEVVCHGTTPFSYLLQHIHYLESCEEQRAKRMSFRDPDTFTYTYTFTLYNEKDERFYAKTPKQDDVYQYGYHSAISYRENCYHCLFAREMRIADITISDYKGLGRLAPCSYGETNVSSILVNTMKGHQIINELIKNKHIHADERPLQEPVEGDPQLRFPSQKSSARRDFEHIIIKFDFETTMRIVMKKDQRRKFVYQIWHYPIKILKKMGKTIL